MSISYIQFTEFSYNSSHINIGLLAKSFCVSETALETTIFPDQIPLRLKADVRRTIKLANF